MANYFTTGTAWSNGRTVKQRFDVIPRRSVLMAIGPSCIWNSVADGIKKR